MTRARVQYGVTIFLSAFLLFLVEPMAAKQLLPYLGGSAAVWLTCLVFFQVALLLGYGYARWMARARRPAVHVGLLAAGLALLAIGAVHPLGLSASSGGASMHPVRSIFGALTGTIGLPFLLLASTSPLLQVWLAREEQGRVPYRLFALSNVGSLLALVLYPTLVEPYLALSHQREAWAAGFVVYMVLSVPLAWGSHRGEEPAREAGGAAQTAFPLPVSAASPLRARLLWFLLPMGAAMQLAAVTSHITENIAAIPFFWMLPLAVYLLSFIVAFEFPGLYRRAIVIRLLIVMLASLGYLLTKTNVSIPIGLAIGFFLLECFVVCLFCHAEAYRLRPEGTGEATLFYLLIAGGGAAGTFLIGIACPLLFRANYDLALAFFATALLGAAVMWREGWPQRLLWSVVSVLLFALLVMLNRAYSHHSLLQARNFYGTLRVTTSDSPAETAPMRLLVNGMIEHGAESFAPGMLDVPTTYYARDSGIGLTMKDCCGERPRRIGVIGLGAGTMAAYGRPGDTIRFYEINPLVRPIARNLFTFVRDSKARVSFADGDARMSLEREAPEHFDVLVVDAFSGDAIPLHLLTTQAMALYRRHLAAEGVLAFHVSNKFVDLAPEVAQLARAVGMRVRSVTSATNDAREEYTSHWVLATTNADFFANRDLVMESEEIVPKRGLRVWTDDYSSLLPLMNWGNR